MLVKVLIFLVQFFLIFVSFLGRGGWTGSSSLKGKLTGFDAGMEVESLAVWDKFLLTVLAVVHQVSFEEARPCGLL